MPSTSQSQRAFMCAEKARKKAGKRTKTGMNMRQLMEFCHTSGKLPRKKRDLSDALKG